VKKLVFLAWLLCIADRVTAQASNQHFQVTPENARATVGDSVILRFRVRLDERDLLLDTVPRPASPLPPGVRMLSVAKMHRTSDRIFHGRAGLAFYRPGRQPVPVFSLPFMRIVEGVRQATIVSDSAFINVVPLLPAGNPPLKDIRELQPTAGPPWAPLAIGALLLAGLLLVIRRRRKRAPPVAASREVDRDIAQPTTEPYGIALEKLMTIEREHWPAKGEIARHYQAVADVLRDYLEAAEAVPARERTTGEVLWALPPHLSESGLRERFRELLLEADLVKFARARPGTPEAQRFLEGCRRLLAQWHRARSPEAADAVR
jgi:LPXTG-motif cell wall-anchored protein